MGTASEREHAVLSASSAHRWLYCTKSARLEEEFPDTASEAAEEGTLAHKLAELQLRHYFETVDFGKRKFTAAVNKLKKERKWDDAMLRHAEEYRDYVKAVALKFSSAPHVGIEKKLDLTAYIPEGFGTADCILIGGGELHVIDFKYGQGVPVSAEGNPQMSLYALGAYEACKMIYRIDRVAMHIVQPRIPDGNSTWECSLKELLDFGEFVKGKAKLAWNGEGDFFPSLNTCRFCRAKGKCRARAEKNVELAFAVGKKPPLITNEELGEYLRRGEDVAKWLKDLQEIALAECLAGRGVPGWKAVEGKKSREWTDADAALAALMKHGVPEAVLWERKLLTLPQAEKIVGKKELSEYAGDFMAVHPGKPTLVRESDDREAICNQVTAKEAFGKEKEA